MDEYVEFGDFILTTHDRDLVAFTPPCGTALFFSATDDAWRVDTRIRFHLLICWGCNE